MQGGTLPRKVGSSGTGVFLCRSMVDDVTFIEEVGPIDAAAARL
jgi:hypothetical protein